MLNVQQLGHGKVAVAQFFMSYMTINVNLSKKWGRQIQCYQKNDIFAINYNES